MKSKTVGYAVPVGLLLVTLSASAWAENGQNTPGENYPVLTKDYLLQSFDGSEKPNEVRITPALHNRYFYSNCSGSKSCDSAIPAGAMMFNAPSGFGSTPHSEFPRVELRATHNFVNGSDFDNEQRGSVYIVKNPSTRSIIFAQIHGDKPGGSEMLKLRWEDGAIVAGVKENYGDAEKRTTLLSGVGLKEKIDYSIKAKGTGSGMKVTVEASAGGKKASQTFDYPKQSWEGIQLYFKAGNYNQDKNKDGSGAVVAYSHLDVRYR
jgi:hypothetical protein